MSCKAISDTTDEATSRTSRYKWIEKMSMWPNIHKVKLVTWWVAIVWENGTLGMPSGKHLLCFQSVHCHWTGVVGGASVGGCHFNLLVWLLWPHQPDQRQEIHSQTLRYRGWVFCYLLFQRRWKWVGVFLCSLRLFIYLLNSFFFV